MTRSNGDVGTVRTWSAARPSIDVTVFLALWLLTLYFLSARLTFPGFGAIGQPATLLALGAGLWWLVARLVPELGADQGFQPVRTAVFVFGGYLVASYGVGASRSLTELEQSGATRALITMVALASVALLATDGIEDLGRLRMLLRRLSTIGALFAAYGILQSVTGESHLLVPPGMVWNQDIEPNLLARGGFVRPIATAMHSIEYAVVVAALLPLAIHFILYPRTPTDRVVALLEAALLLTAIPVSLSRTAVVCVLAALIVLSFGWTWRRRVNALVVGLLVVPIISSIVPALFSFMVELFVGSGDDPSVTDRIDRIPRIMELIRERPWFGWGHGTYNVEEFFLIDNQLWVTTISVGIVGLILTLALPLVAASAAVWPSHDRPELPEEARHLGRVIAAAIAGLMASTVTFTAFTYRVLTFTLFLLIGCAGAYWRLTRSSDVEVSDRGRSR